MNLDPLTSNILVVGAQAVVLLILFFLVNWILHRCLGAIAALPAMRRFAGTMKLLQRKTRLASVIVFLLLVLGLGGANAYLLIRGENLAEYGLEALRGLPRSVWIDLAIALGKVAGLAIVIGVATRLLRYFLDAACKSTKAFDGITANDESIDRFFSATKRMVGHAGWLLLTAFATIAFGLPAAVAQGVLVALKIYLIVALGVLCWRALGALIDSADGLSHRYPISNMVLDYYQQLRHLVPLLRRSLEYVIYVTVASLVALQVQLIAPLAGWGPRLIRIIGIVFLSRVTIELANLLVEEFLIKRARLSPDAKQRRQTMVPLLRSVLKYGIYFCTAVIVLKELGVNPMPVLAGAGIAGLAVGLGAQELINDVLSGFFILFEEYYLVGDFIQASEAEGKVESIELRTTRIRDSAGRLHIVRNGRIGDLINYSKRYTHAVVEVGVAYESDLDRVLQVLETIGKQLHESHPDVLEPTAVKGLQTFGESELTLRTVTKVKPGRHLQAERDLRKMIKETFDREGIEIPYARRVVILQGPEPQVAAGGAAAEPAG